jgi:hypothetical protein
MEIIAVGWGDADSNPGTLALYRYLPTGTTCDMAVFLTVLLVIYLFF